jgi:hypothetical protein
LALLEELQSIQGTISKSNNNLQSNNKNNYMRRDIYIYMSLAYIYIVCII